VDQNPLASPSAAESQASSVIGAGVGDAAAVEFREPEHGDDPDVRVLDRQEEPVVRDVGGGPSHCRGEVVGPRAAAVVGRAEGCVAADLLVGRVRVKQEGAGQFTATITDRWTLWG
jgi:hypothetical protein